MQNNSTWAHSPPSQAPWPPESFKIVPSLLAAAGAIVVVLVALVAYVSLALRLGAIDPLHLQEISPPQLLISQLVAYVPLAAYLIAVVPRVAGVSLRGLGIRTPTLRELGIGVLGTAVMWLAVVATSAAVEALTHHHDTEAAIALLRNIKTPFEKITFIAIAVVFAPLVEELTFRVFVFNALWRWMPLPAAAIASGALFGEFHALGASSSQLLTVGLPLGIGGVVLAAVYARTRCYWSSVVTHGLFNGIELVAFFVFGVKS